jgi:hypothetical protein
MLAAKLSIAGLQRHYDQQCHHTGRYCKSMQHAEPRGEREDDVCATLMKVMKKCEEFDVVVSAH